MAQHNAQRVSRREFLNYAWAASIAFVLAAGGSLTYLFALPRQRDMMRRYGLGEIVVGDSAPFGFVIQDRYGAIAHTPRGVCALSMICPHMNSRMMWSDVKRQAGTTAIDVRVDVQSKGRSHA
jgi:hypothetical protein